MSDDERQWEIKVSVPMRLPVEQRQELFSAVVAAVEEWEPAPADRDEWDADVAGCPADEWSEIVALSSSRQAWAEEALREREQYRDLLGDIWLYVGWRYVTKQLTTEQKDLWADAVDAFGETGEDGPKADRWWLDGEPASITVCACPTDEQLAKLGSGFTRPQCTVHPEGGAR